MSSRVYASGSAKRKKEIEKWRRAAEKNPKLSIIFSIKNVESENSQMSSALSSDKNTTDQSEQSNNAMEHIFKWIITRFSDFFLVSFYA